MCNEEKCGQLRIERIVLCSSIGSSSSVVVCCSTTTTMGM
jgi:hypothetical protein